MAKRCDVVIAGVDGTPAGWVVVSCDDALGDVHAFCVEGLADLPRGLRVAAVDVPIGLAERGPRLADSLARRALGPRGSSVFPTPVRAVLGARSWEDACARHERADGRRLSKQTFGILRKIAEADAFLRASRWARRTLYEVHPELAFARWAGAPMRHQKKTTEGRAERLALIASTFGARAFDDARQAVRGHQVRADDLADAFATLWTAARIRAGTAERRPADRAVDREGLPMVIWT
jgi:predicted RNase H-like nuclease